MKGNPMTPEQERHIGTIRKSAFPSPSPFGPEYERQRIREAYELLNG